MRGSIVIYDSWGRMISALPDEQALELVRMIFAYSFEDTYPLSNDQSVNAMFGMIREKLDEDAEAWERTRQARSEAGRKGGIASSKAKQRLANVSKGKQSQANQAVSVSVSEYVSVYKDKEKDKKESPRFIKPSIDDVRAYISEKGYHIDAQSFVDFYESKGWRVGNSPMKDWKACVRTWERRESKPGKTANFNQYTQTEYDYAELERKLIKN